MDKKKSLVQFIKFGIVGFSNTLIGYIIYALTLYVLQRLSLFENIDIYIAQFVMFVLSVAWSFFWNKRIVFKENNGKKRIVFRALVKTYISYAFTSLFLSEVLLWLWVDVLGINKYLAPILCLIVTVPLNFIIQKYWVFKD